MNRHIKNGMLSMGVWILFLVVLFGSYMTFTDSPFSDLLDEETGGFFLEHSSLHGHLYGLP